MVEISKKDWKLFRERIPEWQEHYMEKLVKEYIELLSSSGNASDHFWELEKRIRKDKKHPGVLLEMTKSDAIWNILEQQQDRAGIPAYIEEEAPVGNKTGGARGITADAALVKGDFPFVLVIIFNETYVPEADEWMRHLARDIFEELKHGSRI